MSVYVCVSALSSNMTFFCLLVYVRQTNHLLFRYSLFGTNSAIKFNLVLQLIWTNQTSKLNFAFESSRVHWKSIISNKSFSHVTLAHVSPEMNNLSNILQSDPFVSIFFNLYHNFLLNPIYWKNYVHHSNNLPILHFQFLSISCILISDEIQLMITTK